uniref:Uncharacterized protein n=1 Tax=Anguilla anguilla TaxID=7936 RepID=A0A0E9XWA6_ANGAN
MNEESQKKTMRAELCGTPASHIKSDLLLLTNVQ